MGRRTRIGLVINSAALDSPAHDSPARDSAAHDRAALDGHLAVVKLLLSEGDETLCP